MTVKELKEKIANIDDNFEVLINEYNVFYQNDFFTSPPMDIRSDCEEVIVHGHTVILRGENFD